MPILMAFDYFLYDDLESLVDCFNGLVRLAYMAKIYDAEFSSFSAGL